MIPPHLFEQLCNYCSYQDRCWQEVVRKLKKWQIPESSYPEIKKDLVEEGFLDEERFARVFADGKFRIKNWGPAKIRYALRSKGIKEDLIEKAMESRKEQDFMETASRLAEKKWALLKGEPREKKSKLVRFLAGKGYSASMCFELAKKLEKGSKS